MKGIEKGCLVSLHYTGKFEDGKVFDSSIEKNQPITFTVGSGHLKGLDEGVIGMKPGDKKTLTLPPEKAFGSRNENNVHEFDKNIFYERDDFEIGTELTLKNEQGQMFRGIIKEVKEQTIVIDFNSVLAGKTLVFDIEIITVAHPEK